MTWIDPADVNPEDHNPVRKAVQYQYALTMEGIERLKQERLRNEKSIEHLKQMLSARESEAKKLADWLRNNP